MRRIVRSGAREWSIGDPDAWGTPVDLRDRTRASDFFGRLLREPDNATVLRAVLRDTAGLGIGGAATPRTNAEAAEQLAAHAAAGRIRVTELAAPTPEMDTGGHVVVVEKKVPPPSGRSVKLKVWVKFQVVDAASGRGIPNVRLRITTPDGTENFHTTNADGLIEVRDIPAGRCAARCDLKDAKLADTLDFVGMGEAAADGGGEAGSSNGTGGGAANGSSGGAAGGGGGGGGVKRIAEVEAYKVRTGDSILKLAQDAGMRWQDLAKFNWGTDNPDEVHVCLRDIVGCTKRSADGYNYRFDDSDDPGIVLIPRAWEQTGLMTERTHVFRVQSIAIQRVRILQYEDTGYILPNADYTIVDEDGRIISVGRSDARARVRVPDNYQESWPILLGRPRRVIGRVLAVAEGGERRPLAKQVVTVHPWTCKPSEVKTDAEGRISLKDVPEGPVSVRYQDQEAVLFISADVHDAEFLLGAPPAAEQPDDDPDEHEAYPPASAAGVGAITIRIVDPEGRPLPGAAVKVKQDGAEIFAGTADDDGVVIVENARPDAPCDVIVDQHGTMPGEGCVECDHGDGGELPEYTYGEAPHDEAACSCGCDYAAVNDAGSSDEEAVA